MFLELIYATTPYSAEKSICVIHSRWPSKESHLANWPLPDDAPYKIKQMSKKMGTLMGSSVTKPQLSLNDLQRHLKQLNAKNQGSVTSKKKNILIYNDQGAGQRSVFHTVSMMNEVVDLNTCRVLVVNGSYINNIDWTSNTRLIVMPGGRARPYYDALGAQWMTGEPNKGEYRKIKYLGKGNQKIIDFVKSGGSYIGICAGAYYGARFTNFECGNSFEILDPGLSLANVTARGPAYGLNKFRYHSEDGSEVAKVEGKLIPHQSQKVYFNGGCLFEGNNGCEIPKDDIILNFSDIPNKPVAAIRTQYGLGKVLLTSPHFEFLSSEPSLSPDIAKELSGGNEVRKEIFAKMINSMGVPLNEEMTDRLKLGVEQQVFDRTHFDIMGSTQDYLRDNVDQLLKNQKKVVITANEQSKGRGTHNRKWASPPNVNIYATFGIKLTKGLQVYFDATKNPAVASIVAVAVCRTLEDFGFKPQIKWRNDVLVNGKKISGALCEPKLTTTTSATLIGIGLNVNMSKEICNSLDQPVTSMAVAAGHEFDKEKVFNCLAKYVNHYAELYLTKGFSECMKEINDRMAFIGEEIKFERLDGSFVVGKCLGTDETGRLKLENSDGTVSLMRWGRINKEFIKNKAKINQNDEMISGNNTIGYTSIVSLCLTSALLTGGFVYFWMNNMVTKQQQTNEDTIRSSLTSQRSSSLNHKNDIFNSQKHPFSTDTKIMKHSASLLRPSNQSLSTTNMNHKVTNKSYFFQAKQSNKPFNLNRSIQKIARMIPKM